MEWRTRAQLGLRRAAAGLQGSDAHPARSSAGGQRRRARRGDRSTSARERCRAPLAPNRHALSKQDGRRGGVRAHLCASRRRAPRPIECVTRDLRHCDLWRFERSRQCALIWSPRSARRHRAGVDRSPDRPTVSDRNRHGREAAERLGAAIRGVRARSRARVRRHGTSPLVSSAYARKRLCRQSPPMSPPGLEATFSLASFRLTYAEGAPLSHTQPNVMPMQTDTPDRILRIKTVLARTGLSRSTLYRKMDAGTSPASIKISTRCAGLRESAVAEWLQNPMFYSA